MVSMYHYLNALHALHNYPWKKDNYEERVVHLSYCQLDFPRIRFFEIIHDIF